MNNKKIAISIILACNFIVFYIFFFRLRYISKFTYAPVLTFLFAIVVTIIDIIFVVILVVKSRKIFYAGILIVPVLGFLFGNSIISPMITIRLELLKAKNKLEKIATENRIYDDVIYSGNLYFFPTIKNEGGLFALVYDDREYIENLEGAIQNEDGWIEVNLSVDINGYKLLAAKRIEKNWYFCGLRRE